MRIHRSIPPAIAGLALVLAAGLKPAAVAQVTNLVSNTTYEYDPDGRPRWPWTYTYAGDGSGAVTDPYGFTEANLDWGIPSENPTNLVLRFSFDTTLYNFPAGAWYGFGFGAGMNWSAFDPAVLATNRESYVVSFDARLQGLTAGVTTATGEMQVQMDAPDDTIVPVDENGDADRIIQVNIPFEAGTNWAHYRFTLDNGTIGGGSEKSLALYGLQINSMNYNVNLPDPGRFFGFDTDNALEIDNIKLEVVTKEATTPPPTYGVAILDWNFDDKPSDYNYEYGWSANEIQPVWSGSPSAEGMGVGGTNAWMLQMENTEMANNPPAWAGCGSGGGGPVDYAGFNSPDLADYQVSFDARVLGLAAGRTDTTTVLQLFLDAPDDSLQPPDDNTDADLLMRLDFQIASVETNFQHFVFNLSKGSAGGGSKTNFTVAYNKISGLRTQWQIENAASVNDWGYDADNALIIDNVKLERIYTGTSPLNFSFVNKQLVLSWSGSAKLQSSVSVDGQYTDVAGATSPYGVPLTGASRFFRTQLVTTP